MRAVGLVALLLLVTACAGQFGGDRPPWRIVPANAVDTPDHLIVTVDADTPDALAALSEGIAADHPVRLVGEWPLKSIDVHCFVFRVASPDVSGTVAALAADSRVRTVQPMNRFATVGRHGERDLVPLQDGLAALDALPVHAVARGSGVRVAVIDTRADADHPDLAARIAVARDFVRADTPPVAEMHGTAVAGVIAADDTDGRGMTGVAPGADVLALRGCWETRGRPEGRCSTFSLAQALNFALLNDADVINLSLAGPHDPLIAELIGAALDRGMVVVVAEGGEAGGSFPAELPGTIAVTDGADLRPRPTGRGSAPLIAPGREILSAAPRGSYDFFTGSSIAAAHVSGIVALLRDARPGASPESVARALRAGGWGRVNACRAVYTLAPSPDLLRCAGAGPDEEF